MQAADAQSSSDQENIAPHQLVKQEIARRLLSQELAQRQSRQQQQQS